MTKSGIINVAFDTETTLIGMKPKIDPKVTTNNVPRLVCLSYYSDYSEKAGSAHLLQPSEAILKWREWVRDPQIRLIGQNVAFDMAVMTRAAYEAGFTDILTDVFDAYQDESFSHGKINDTQIRQNLIDIATTGGKQRLGRPSLENMVEYYFDEDLSEEKQGDDAWRLRYGELEGVPIEDWPDAAFEYAAMDAVWTYRVWEAQFRKHGERWHGVPVSSEKGVINERFQTMAGFSCYLMSSWGIRADLEETRQLKADYEARLRELRGHLQSIGVIGPDGTQSMEETRRLYAKAFKEAGIEPVRSDKTNKISTGKKSRRKLARNGYTNKNLTRLVEFGRINRYITQYLEPLLEAGNHAICPYFKPLVDSGRTACSKPNLQNFPKRSKPQDTIAAERVRDCFRPREGNVFITADWSSAELRTLAQVNLNLGHEPVRMAEVLRSGKDLHLDFGAKIMDIPYEEAERRISEDDEEVKRARQLAKVPNFGFPAGQGPKGLIEYAQGYGFQLTLERTTELQELWMDSWPEMEDYFNWAHNQKKRGRYPVMQHPPGGDLDGVWRLRNCDRWPVACNTLFQGLAADGAKISMWNILRECYVEEDSPLYGYRINAFVHDEFLLEGPPEGCEEAGRRLEELMIQGMDVVAPDVPHEVDVEIGHKWGSADIVEL